MRNELSKQFGPDVAHAAMLIVMAQASGGLSGLILLAEVDLFVSERKLDIDAINAALQKLREERAAFEQAGDVIEKARAFSKKIH